MIVNIIVVGAKDNTNFFGEKEEYYSNSEDDSEDEEYEWNNIRQASHYDMVNFMQSHANVQIRCYDLLYKYYRERDNITYYTDKFYVGNTDYLCANAKNIIIDFCDLLNGKCNNVNHIIYGYSRVDYSDDSFSLYDEYDVTYLACGSTWSCGFPIDCIKYIMNIPGYYTPFNRDSVDNYLYVMSSINCIYNIGNETLLRPYLRGLQHVMEDLIKVNKNKYSTLKELLQLIWKYVSDEDKQYLNLFMSGQKNWNGIPLQIRTNVHNIIYRAVDMD